MKFLFRTFIIFYYLILNIPAGSLQAQPLYKFERLSTADGLSQNYVQSIFCDHRGFLWFGTWDGLNRYDGKNFKIFKVNPNQQNSLTNNRIIDIWQDRQYKLWVKTNDGYIHTFNEKTYDFITYPYYLKSLEERNSTINCFAESAYGEVFLGSSNSGLYYLTHNDVTDSYDERQFLNRGTSTISDNHINFILNDAQDNIWIGTHRGLNYISRQALQKQKPEFSNFWLHLHFTTACAMDSMLFFGTRDAGIKTYLPRLGKFDTHPALFEKISQKSIRVLKPGAQNNLFVGTENDGLYIYDLQNHNLSNHLLSGKSIQKIYLDAFGITWINTTEFGIYRLSNDLKSAKHFDLTTTEIKSTVDDERQFIYEDSKNNMWIALHGGGLARYDRQHNAFDFYRNHPGDNMSISSDNVYCITEDQSGMLWVGTGIPEGGVNKVLSGNDAFRQIMLDQEVITGNENVVRSLLIDTNNHLWAGTKAGSIYVLDSQFNVIARYDNMPLTSVELPIHNAYTMMQDRDGYIWIGTKAGGIFVTQQPINTQHANYKKLKFYHYAHDPGNTSSLSSNIIYSLLEDSNGTVWIGSYEGGLNRVLRRDEHTLSVKRYNTANSGLSSDKVRYLYEDDKKRLWITTAFGLNYCALDKQHIYIKNTLFDPRKPNSLSYNDIIHAYQDSQHQLWFGSSGGGVNLLMADRSDSLQFQHIGTKDGLINDVVYAIAEDKQGHLWFSTDHGISRYFPADSTFENFDQSNNMPTDAFNENTCASSPDGSLIFGTNNGLLIIYPDSIHQNQFKPNVVFTNFQLFNKDVDIRDPEAPVRQDIETLDKIDLKYFESSFSVEYAALSYFAPTKNKYAFKLENFDNQWNEVANQTKATYTNLSPGEYIFKVKAANPNSDWNNKARSIIITIHPPWWKTNIMYGVYMLIFVIIFEVIRRSYARYHKLQNDLVVEKRVNDIKLQFFTNVSHEIRTPLTLILGPIQDLLDLKNIPDTIRRKLLLVEKNGKRMLRLVNQLLDFRKVQQQKMKLKIQPVALTSFIGSIVENFDLIAQHKNVKINYDTAQENCEIWVDPNKFDAVIFNILSNAIKFSPAGSQVYIRLIKSEKNIQISMTDQGSGISKDRINQIFERFSPLADQNNEYGSSGIGLAYSYQIMKLHHGDIAVESEPGKGSVFTISVLLGKDHFTADELDLEKSLPVDHVQRIADDRDDEIEVSGETQQASGHEKILIVEDNTQILHYLQENLCKTYQITTSHHGREALEAIRTNAPDIIITDIMMPEMDGIELTKMLKNSFETSHIPVIMLTAKSSVEDQIEGIDSGAEAYILKPFNMAYVRAVISNLIKQRKTISMKYLQGKLNDLPELNITSKDEKFLEDVNKLVMENYADPEFNIEKLVGCSYVSRTVFYHKIKSLTGLPPIEFLRQKRLNMASQLLLKSDYNISEIAYNTGFNDTKYFSRKFKALFGATPSEYRQQHFQTSNT